MGAIIVAALLAAAPTPASTTIGAGERPDRAVMLVITPGSTAPTIPSSNYLDAAQRVFGRETSLSLASAEQAGVDANAMRECPVDLRLRCWARLARADDRNVARFLLVLSVQPVAGNDRVTLLVLDLERVQRVLEDPASADDPEAQEQRIFELARQLQPEVLSPEESGAPERLLGDLVARELRDDLEESGHFRPYGEIELESETADLVIDLDGRVIGTTSGEHTLIREVSAGERVLSLRRADGWSTSRRIQVTRGGTTWVEMEDPPSSTHPARPVVWVGGFVMAAAGLTLLGITAASTSGDLQSACLQRGPSDSRCGALGTFTHAYEGPDAAPTTNPAAVNPSGLLMAPLGVGLASGGLATSLGTLLLGDEADFPWPQVLVGLATAGLVYGMGAALDAR